MSLWCKIVRPWNLRKVSNLAQDVWHVALSCWNYMSSISISSNNRLICAYSAHRWLFLFYLLRFQTVEDTVMFWACIPHGAILIINIPRQKVMCFIREENFPAAPTPNLRQFQAVHGLWVRARGFTDFSSGVCAWLHAKCAKKSLRKGQTTTNL